MFEGLPASTTAAPFKAAPKSKGAGCVYSTAERRCVILLSRKQIQREVSCHNCHTLETWRSKRTGCAGYQQPRQTCEALQGQQCPVERGRLLDRPWMPSSLRVSACTWGHLIWTWSDAAAVALPAKGREVPSRPSAMRTCDDHTSDKKRASSFVAALSVSWAARFCILWPRRVPLDLAGAAPNRKTSSSEASRTSQLRSSVF